MTSFQGSPQGRSANSFIERYVQNVNADSLPTSPLKPISPTKINSPTPNSSTLQKLKSNFETFNNSNKENVLQFSVEFKSPLRPTLKSSSSPKIDKLSNSSPKKIITPINNAVDLSKYSKEDLKYYEFLCRVGEVKKWIEHLIEEKLPSEIDLCAGDALRDGVILAKVTQRINPELAPSIFPSGNKLQFKHTQNINAFFSLLEHVGVPDSFRFELQDLYNKKDLPQVFEALHILITIINKKWPGKTPLLSNLSGQLYFNQEDIRKCKRTWPRIRDFKSLGTVGEESPNNKISKKTVPDGIISDFDEFERFSKPIRTSEAEFKTPNKKLVISKPVITDESTQIDSKGGLQSPFQLRGNAEFKEENTTRRPTYYPSPSIRSSDIENFNRTPQLNYSPTKNMSLSYYSPSISRHLGYDTEFYKRRSQARKEDIEYYQSFNYSPSRYSPVRRQKMNEEEFLGYVINLQSRCKGSNTRFGMYMQDRLLELFKKELKSFQLLCKGSLVRRSISKNVFTKLNDTDSEDIQNLQAFLKGSSLRYGLDKFRFSALRQESLIIYLQSKAKGHVIRKKSSNKLSDLRSILVPIQKLQAIIRGQNRRCSIQKHSNEGSVLILQSLLRGFRRRQQISNIVENLENKCKNIIVVFQANTRSKMVRSNFSRNFEHILKYDKNINDLITRSRGYSIRRHYRGLIECTENNIEKIEKLQASVRGILVRYTLDLVDDVIEYNSIDMVQAILRGALLRSALTSRSKHFERNERSIIMVQSAIRMHLQRKSYIELMEYPNPSLWAVRKYTDLLNDSGSFEDIQNKLESTQASLDAENMKKSKLQSDLRQELDILKVLETFNISDGHTLQLQRNSTVPESKYPYLNKLFFFLQVNPVYWRTLYTHRPDFVERNLYLNFTTANQKMRQREKTYFIRLVADLMQHSIVESTSICEFIHSDIQFWERLLTKFLQREYPDLFSLFIPVLDYINNPLTNFESDPDIIYEKLYGNRCKSNISPISDNKVQSTFVENLRCLWHAVEMIAEIFTRKIDDIPIELKYICTKIFGYAADKNSNELDSLRCISKVLIGCFVNEYLFNREKYGYEDRKKEQSNNMIYVLVESLFNVFESSKFEGYYEPLNQYNEEIEVNIREILYTFLIEPDYEQDAESLIYNDIVSQSPKLEILSQKAKEILVMFKDNISRYSDKDIIHEVLKKCKEEKIIPNNGRLMLDLDASSYRFLVSDDKMRKLYDQVKRSFIYMTQIEEVDTNLYDLALTSVLPEDEPLFEELLYYNRAIANDPMIKALNPLSYFSLKSATLKRIHELENAGVISSSDNRLQNILNDIANTIKNPNYAINYVKHELDITYQTLDKISQINAGLNHESLEIKASIDQLLKNLQRSREFVPADKGTFGNFKDAVKKVGHKEGTELQGLKYKWTTRQLYEKGVVKKISGEKLAESTIKVFGSSGPKYPDIIFRLSTSDGSRFGIQLVDKRKGPEKKLAEIVDSFTFRNLLSTQVGESKPTLDLLNSKVTVDSSKLLKLVIETFFR